jgi:lipoprotein-anchoring transpeptidase ErfK/SrfK
LAIALASTVLGGVSSAVAQSLPPYQQPPYQQQPYSSQPYPPGPGYPGRGATMAPAPGFDDLEEEEVVSAPAPYGAAPADPRAQPSYGAPNYGAPNAGYGVPQQAGVAPGGYPDARQQAPQAGDPYSNQAMRPPGEVGAPGAQPAPGQPIQLSALPPEDQPETGPQQELPPNLKRQEVAFQTKEPAGTIIVDTANTYLYYVLGNGRAMRYGVRVGREGFTWAGTQKISRKAEWPDWYPPAEMIERQPYLPRFMAGGEGNPMGARAMYLGSTVYRIHGTNQPSTIGKFVSSGCVGMLNEDVADLFERVKVGTRVVVWPGKPPVTASAAPAVNASQATGSTMPPPAQGNQAGNPVARNDVPGGVAAGAALPPLPSQTIR